LFFVPEAIIVEILLGVSLILRVGGGLVMAIAAIFPEGTMGLVAQVELILKIRFRIVTIRNHSGLLGCCQLNVYLV
jgi:hypothetical protein